MKKDTPVSPFAFSAFDLIRKTFQFVWANGGILLWCYLPPIVVQLVVVWLGYFPAGQFKALNESLVWAIGLPVLQGWLLLVSQLRTMRFTLLGERPNAYFAFEVFNARAWRLLLCYFWVGIQILAIGGLVLLLPLAFIQYVLAAHPLLSGAEQFGWALSAQAILVLLLGSILLVKRVVLFAPNIAMDGRQGLAQLGRRASPAKGALFRAFLLLNVLPLAIICLVMTFWVFSPGAGQLCTVLSLVFQIVAPLIYMIQAVAYALVYMHLRPLLEGEDPKPETAMDLVPAQS